MTDSNSPTARFTDEERDAMKQRAAEMKAEAKRATQADKAAADLQDVLDKIASMAPADREIAERVHAIVTENAPTLAPKLWYGSPAYALDGTVICFFQESTKFKVRYATLGFSDAAKLDDGNFWPSSYAVAKLTASDEKVLAELVKKAVEN